MSRLLEIGAMTVGGVSLFAVSFLGFAASSDTPLSEVAVIGPLFAEGQETPPADAPELPLETPAVPDDRGIYSSQRGGLSSYHLPLGIDQQQVERLVGELKARAIALDLRERELQGREDEVQARNELLDEQFETLSQLRAGLEALEQELLLREQEIEGGELAATERREEYFKNHAAILSAEDTDEAAQKLLEFEVQDAARVLHQMNPKDAQELLNALPDARYRAFADAYAEGGA